MDYEIDWTEIVKHGPGIATCPCDARYVAHCKFVIKPSPGLVSKEACPKCGQRNPCRYEDVGEVQSLGTESVKTLEDVVPFDTSKLDE